MSDQINSYQSESPARENPNARQADDSEAAKGLAAKTHDAAERLKGSAIEQVGIVREQAESGRERAAERVRRLGGAIRNAGQDLRDQDDAFVAKYADVISDKIERTAEYIGSLEPRTLVDDATQLARQRPALFFGGAFLLGLAAARFLKSSEGNGGSNGDDRSWRVPRPGVPTVGSSAMGRRGAGP
jgi:hypothetical protein